MSFWKIGLIGALAAVAIPVGCSVLSTATTVATAPGRVINKTLETNNIIFNYEAFFDQNAAYEARLAQVKQFKALYEDEDDLGERSRLRIEMAAMQQSCRDLAAKYNAQSEKINASIFKSKSLPATLSATDCE